MDLQFEELKGFIDLGFRKIKIQTWFQSFLGCKDWERKMIAEIESFDEPAITRLYLSEAWEDHIRLI
ncbi:hypothetical protein DVH24_041546 [Malus domestica]|uniref:Uncharacterized protein n=1 Tax=Malus domestica TaxID=3750 RepID=A0A498IBQ9_MALDO|nr:hypothetical protein DVH24_041546 [Malus domestica]